MVVHCKRKIKKILIYFSLPPTHVLVDQVLFDLHSNRMICIFERAVTNKALRKYRWSASEYHAVYHWLKTVRRYFTLELKLFVVLVMMMAIHPQYYFCRRVIGKQGGTRFHKLILASIQKITLLKHFHWYQLIKF